MNLSCSVCTQGGFISPPCAFVNTQVSKELIDCIDQYNVIGDVCLSFVQSERHSVSLPQV